MSSVYVQAAGIHAEYCSDLNVLHAALHQLGDGKGLAGRDTHPPSSVRLSASELQAIAREDRSILNDLAIVILNAAGDLLRNARLENGLALAEDTPLYSGTDGVAEYGFVVLSRLIQRHGSPGQTLRNLGQLSSMTNPINMMRFLSTNPVYHASKRLELRGGGYPVRGMSLSGLYALEDAAADLAAGRSRQGLVVAAGNMRNFDSLVVFGKLGLLDRQNDAGSFVPAFGAAALLLGRDPKDAAAEVLDVHSRYSPAPFPDPSSWRALMEYASDRGVRPDVVVTYCNGVKANDENECAAVRSCFPDAQLCNYKRIFGYTGKANNALDLVAALADENIPVGAVLLINGAGFGAGIGFIALRKLKHYSAHRAFDELGVAA